MEQPVKIISDLLPFNVTGAVPYTATNPNIKRVDNCNGYVAVNTGDDIAFVDDQILYPGVPGTSIGDVYNNLGNRGEIFLGVIKLRFNGVGANPEVTINQRFYILDRVVNAQNG